MWYVICFMCMFPKASQLFLNVPMMSHKLKRTLIRPLKRVRVYDSSLVCFQYDMLLNAGFFCNLFFFDPDFLDFERLAQLNTL